MQKMYNSNLHKFIEQYLKAQGAFIDYKKDTYFEAVYPDGRRIAYTYSAKVAAADKNIRLLAKASKALKEIIETCSSKAALSSVSINYNLNSVKKSLEIKECCNLCPFFPKCESHTSCCSFCHLFRSCNTVIENAYLEDLGTITHTENLEIICFVFTIEIANYYTQNIKIENDIAVLVDAEKSQVIRVMRVQDILGLDINTGSGFFTDTGKYYTSLNTARKYVEKIVDRQLEVFKKDIERPVFEKVQSIINKYRQEYTDIYTVSTLEELEELQHEALELCRREIRANTINTDIHLKNVILLKTTCDTRKIILKSKSCNLSFPVEAELLLSSANIICNSCGSEIDQGYLCDNGHIICRQCGTRCYSCGRIICDVCDDDSYICSTCGEIFCNDCIQSCSSCGSVVCSYHAFRCSDCHNLLCIDCFIMCEVCGRDLCKNHAKSCNYCHNEVCSEHSVICSTCNYVFCTNHVEDCSICKSKYCLDHIFHSQFSGKSICSEHSRNCGICGGIFATDEMNSCTSCGKALCPDHSHACAVCGNIYCQDHVQHCLICSKDYCTCDTFSTCKICGNSYCSSCVGPEGVCHACKTLKPSYDKDICKTLGNSLPSLLQYKKFYITYSYEITTVYAKSFSGGTVAVFDRKNNLISCKTLGFTQKIKLDYLLWRYK